MEACEDLRLLKPADTEDEPTIDNFDWPRTSCDGRRMSCDGRRTSCDGRRTKIHTHTHTQTCNSLLHLHCITVRSITTFHWTNRRWRVISFYSVLFYFIFLITIEGNCGIRSSSWASARVLWKILYIYYQRVLIDAQQTH